MDIQLREQLLSIDSNAFKEFSFDGYNTCAKVLRIHDPDTMTIGFRYANEFYKKNIRLTGIDAPELHSKNADEAKLCKLATKYLTQLYLNKLVRIHMGTMDKYGRILATIYDLNTNECINEKLISCKFARAYGVKGGKANLHKDEWSVEEIQEGIRIAGQMNLQV